MRSARSDLLFVVILLLASSCQAFLFNNLATRFVARRWPKSSRPPQQFQLQYVPPDVGSRQDQHHLLLRRKSTAAPVSDVGGLLQLSGEEDATPFDWWRQWYPVVLLRDLDASVPTRVTLLGRDLVIWKDGKEGKWRCFLDRCPHRLAPLSEGRVDPKEGFLQCAYHGWDFDGDGTCTKIPQADPDNPTTAMKSRRACATALPCVSAQGMIWVWADGSEEGIKASISIKPNLMEGVDEKSMSYLVVSRDMPYGFDTLLENGIDPSHLPFAHHNIISNRNQAAYIDITVNNITKAGFDSDNFFPRRRPSLPAGAANDRLKKRSISVPQSLHFRPPNLLYQIINVTEALNKVPLLPKKERVIRIVTYAVPTAPGRARVIYRFVRNYFLLPSFLRWVSPEWLEHLRILRVLDSDTVFLHGQERELQNANEAEIDKVYYMPTPADGSVRALRKWIKRFGGPKWLVDLPPGLPPYERDRRVLLDRYESHTKTCKVCSGALTNIGRLRHVIGFFSVMAFYLGLLGQSVYTRLAGGFLTVLGITGVLILRKFEQLFFYQPWNHSKND